MRRHLLERARRIRTRRHGVTRTAVANACELQCINRAMEVVMPEKKQRISRETANTAQLHTNVGMGNVDASSSTFSRTSFAHCVFTESSFLNSFLNDVNFLSATFNSVSFDGALFENCNLENVEIRSSNINGLVINGFDVGSLISTLTASRPR